MAGQASQSVLPNDFDFVERHYPADEAKILWKVLEQSRKIPNIQQRNQFGRKLLRKIYDDDLTWLQRTFWITDKSGTPKLLELNHAQNRFYRDVIVKCREDNRPIRAIILKARQLGFSTFVQAYQYTMCSLYQNRNALTVSYDSVTTKSLLAKAFYGHQRMWYPRDLRFGSKENIEFDQPHGSMFHGLTAGQGNVGRGFTFHHVHCSEIPMWPDPSTVLAGMAESIPKSPLTSVFWESTARGMSDPFYEGWQDAVAGNNEFIPFFCPWFWDPEYSTKFRNGNARNGFMKKIEGTPEEQFMRLYELTPEQMNWRRKKIDSPSMSDQLFRQEYPSCADEAFLMSGNPVFDMDAIVEMSRRCVKPLWCGEIALERA